MVFQRAKTKTWLSWAALAGLVIAVFKAGAAGSSQDERPSEAPRATKDDDGPDEGESSLSLWP